MDELKPTGWSQWAVIVLLGVVIVLDSGASIYHFTHRGLGSGITELILAILLLTAVYLVSVVHTQHSDEVDITFSRSRKAGLAIIAVAVPVILFLSIYHLTHQGLRSGAVEMSMTSLLAISGYLISRNQRK